MKIRCPRLACPLLLAAATSAVSACGLLNASPDYSKPPVLLVHGSGMHSGWWDEMIRHLVRIGYPREYLFAVDLAPDNGSNIPAAEHQIAPAVEMLLGRVRSVSARAGHARPPFKVDLVTHSMGAASGRWYAARIAPERVRVWISLAGANHGTDALAQFDGAGDREMVPSFASSVDDNRLQVLLNGTREAPLDETPFGLGVDSKPVERVPPDEVRSIAYYTVSIDPDRWIQPSESALLDGAGGGRIEIPDGVPAEEISPGNFLFRGDTDHDGLIGHRDAIRLVAAILEAGADGP
jgi:pimeloyl-ACP methyl ester carboxylesterase